MSTNAMKNMMKGTDGSFDYVVVAEADCLRIGIKPLIEVRRSKQDPETGVAVLTFLAGIRIRAEKKDAQTIVDVAKCVDNVVPKITWAKKDHHRASTVIACDTVTSEGWTNEKEFVDGLCNHDYVMEMWMALSTALQTDHLPVSDMEYIREFFKARIEKDVAGIMTKVAQMGLSLKPKGSLNNVVNLHDQL